MDRHMSLVKRPHHNHCKGKLLTWGVPSPTAGHGPSSSMGRAPCRLASSEMLSLSCSRRFKIWVCQEVVGEVRSKVSQAAQQEARVVPVRTRRLAELEAPIVGSRKPFGSLS